MERYGGGAIMICDYDPVWAAAFELERTCLHGVLGAEKAEQCAQCHGEHHGASFSIVNRQSFLLAGSKNPDKFDHSLIGFEMG